MESLRLFSRLEFNFVSRSEDFVGYWSPAVALNSLVPASVVVILRLIKTDVDSFFLMLLFQRIVVSWCECIDVNDSSMSENFVVN